MLTLISNQIKSLCVCLFKAVIVLDMLFDVCSILKGVMGGYKSIFFPAQNIGREDKPVGRSSIEDRVAKWFGG